MYGREVMEWFEANAACRKIEDVLDACDYDLRCRVVAIFEETLGRKTHFEMMRRQQMMARQQAPLSEYVPAPPGSSLIEGFLGRQGWPYSK